MSAEIRFLESEWGKTNISCISIPDWRTVSGYPERAVRGVMAEDRWEKNRGVWDDQDWCSCSGNSRGAVIIWLEDQHAERQLRRQSQGDAQRNYGSRFPQWHTGNIYAGASHPDRRPPSSGRLQTVDERVWTWWKSINVSSCSASKNPPKKNWRRRRRKLYLSHHGDLHVLPRLGQAEEQSRQQNNNKSELFKSKK